jgi:hypothetical protein
MVPPQHQHYQSKMAVMLDRISEVMDTAHVPTNTDERELTQALQGLHISKRLGYESEGLNEESAHDIDTSRMGDNIRNDDYTIGGTKRYKVYRKENI